MRNSNKRNLRLNYSNISILPLLLIISIIPLIVRLEIVHVSEVSSIFANGQATSYDFFSYNKAIWFIYLTVIGLIIFMYKYLYKQDISIKKTNIYYPMSLYSILVILSTIFSTYKDVALKGFFDRAEGMFVLLGYMICLFIAINLIENEKQIKNLLLALGVSSILISTIGMTQLWGKDILSTSLGRRLMLPSNYWHIMDSIKFAFANTIYGTFYNPNYVGVYMSIILSLSCTILLLSKERIIKAFSGIVALLSFINLVGSGSRTGMASIALYVLLLSLFLRSLIIKKWKISIIAIFIFVILILSVNYYTSGLIKNRLLSIKASTEVESSNLKDIVIEENKVTIIIEDYGFKIYHDSGNFIFKDKEDKEIEANVRENRISFTEEPYNKHYFDIGIYNENLVLQPNILTNKGWASFNIIINQYEQLKFLNPFGEVVDLKKAPHWGFEGKKGFASNRGYIWSRTIPLLKNTSIIGFGPDTYALHFPQDDYLGKLQGMGKADILVDKPHNLYLQTAINTGLVSLISMLIIFIIYIISSIKTYINKNTYGSFIEIAGLGIFLSTCIYLMMSFLNDSIVSVAPVFWILLGTGISINKNLGRDINNK